ncbi:MAG: SprT family zinc-dependent metalloprotease [Bacteroidota bacterium]
MKKRSIDFGSKRIEYSLMFNHRKTLGIAVTPEMEVVVKAPSGAPIEKIDFLVRKRAAWILRQKDFFLGFYPKQPQKRFIGGETHLYLGKQYRLKVLSGRTESVKLRGKYFEVTCSKARSAKGLMSEWYLFHAEWKFQEIVEECLSYFKKVNFDSKDVEIREMSKRWGSCTARGRIILNLQLIRAPRGCIEYVVIHELCHLTHRNHNKNFVDLQTRIMPDWAIWKDRLERLLA